MIAINTDLDNTNAGRVLSHWAGGEGNKAAEAHPSNVPTGFKAQYVQGGQNMFAMVHIAGVAGGTLIGDNTLDPVWGTAGPGNSTTGTEMVAAQFAQDRSQLEMGLVRMRAGLPTTSSKYPDRYPPIIGYPQGYPLKRYVQEKYAEISDDEAGVSVGNILRRQDKTKTFTRNDARREIFNLLCDW